MFMMPRRSLFHRRRHLLGYMRTNAMPVPGKTMNAVLFGISSAADAGRLVRWDVSRFSLLVSEARFFRRAQAFSGRAPVWRYGLDSWTRTAFRSFGSGWLPITAFI